MQINIIHDKPEVYNLYRKRFGGVVDWDKGLIIAYDNAIYCKIMPSSDEIAHEKTHLRQQNDMGVDLWVQKYINDGRFRLSQEIEAYQVQANFLRSSGVNRAERTWKIKAMAKLLSGPIYGNVISFSEALNSLR